MPHPILQINNLHKNFGKIKAVNGINFSIKSGLCVGILGHNGAGKTTTIEILENIIKPSQGEILYRGKSFDKTYTEHIGVQFQSTALQDFLSVYDHLKLFSSFYKTQVDLSELIDLCDLKDFVKQDAGKLSGGQRQRLLLAIALVNQPDILFLDEPTTGLDPQARQNFWRLIQTIKKRGTTIVLTTHYMEEAYQLCDDLLIMNQGKIISKGHPKTLLKQHFKAVILSLPLADISKIPHLSNATIHQTENFLEISTESINHCLSELLAQEISLDHLIIKEPTLDDLFLKLTN